MLFRNDGKGESNVIQNQFTVYLVSALRRKNRGVLQVWMRVSENEFSVDFQDCLLDTPNEQLPLSRSRRYRQRPTTRLTLRTRLLSRRSAI